MRAKTTHALQYGLRESVVSFFLAPILSLSQFPLPVPVPIPVPESPQLPLNLSRLFWLFVMQRGLQVPGFRDGLVWRPSEKRRHIFCEVAFEKQPHLSTRRAQT